MLNMEVKGNLARLLATENLIVEHRKVETAMFNVKDRVLTLPMWDVASPNVYDMLVGHEVGHALYTPDKWGSDFGVPQSYLNVCEDARIEKMMKRKFPGLARNFYTGYKELNDADFFEVGDRPMDSYQLIDRINLYFKIGVHAGEVFTWKPEEKVLVDELEVAETFDDVVDVARKILQYTQEQQKIEVEMDTANATQGGGDSTLDGGEGESEQPQQVSGDGNQTQGGADTDQPNESGEGNQTSAGQSGGTENIESETDKAFSEKQKQLSSNPYARELNYIELPPLNVETFVIPNKQVMEDCRVTYGEQAASLFTESDSSYQKFRAESQREVNYLVKEFEMRKSADQYARASTAKTGVLDTQKLHTYKWNEDVFKKINVVPDGKNHGLIFILDWSGSMGNCLMDTVKQLLNLAWFCKKVQIPFDIYAFTNDYWASRSYDYSSSTRTKSKKHHKEIPGYVSVYENFRLLNMVSSNGRNGKDLEAQLKNFWRLANSEGGYRSYCNPPGYCLSGTPLHEAAISLTAVIPDFQKRNKVQKTNVVILTDGESQSINYIVENRYRSGRVGYNHIDNDCVLRDRKTGRVYPRFEGGYYGCSDKITKVFLQNVRDRFPDVNLIGIRLVNGRHLNSTYSNDTCKTPYTEIQKQWQKTKTAELVDFLGYQSLYLMALDGLAATTEFEVEEDATSKEIGNAFKKALAKKGVNKKMLTSFATLIS
jgi:hypothetical protein